MCVLPATVSYEVATLTTPGVSSDGTGAVAMRTPPSTPSLSGDRAGPDPRSRRPSVV
ncbi:hypothetical protein [Microbispora sp. GKU 823]|uniref:hypothetical protein n=1 Tax=Microbispora sp. GKU 823 TaxID=1652100 RepID=UPI002119317C|nr:hypothetical protein [Microbispora sp. GKU 823]